VQEIANININIFFIYEPPLYLICKSDYILANLKSTYPYLAWDNFENVQIYESELENSEDIAMYLKSKNIIIVNKPVFTKNDYIAQYN